MWQRNRFRNNLFLHQADFDPFNVFKVYKEMIIQYSLLPETPRVIHRNHKIFTLSFIEIG